MGGDARATCCTEDLSEPAEVEVDHLVIGCGAYARLQIPTATRGWLDALGVSWSAHPAEAAVAAYNRGLAAAERMAAALHLTC